MYNTIINKVAKELNLDPTLIRKVYKNYWLCIREHIKPLPLKEDLSEEEFNSLITNFNIPSLGKLHCTYDKYKNIKKSYNNAKAKKD
jgi:hypothetical protein